MTGNFRTGGQERSLWRVYTELGFEGGLELDGQVGVKKT